ncbi:hypothetical protein KKA47_01065, partial [bacterium]|nr:hypothetical protein [bacterium]
HLTAELDQTAPYTGPHKSWGAENLAQSEQLIEFVGSKAGLEPQIIAGDINHGAPDKLIPIVGELAENYYLWRQNNYLDLAMSEKVGCSWCGENNNLVRKKHDKENKLIDHIFIKNLPVQKTKTTVIFNKPVEISNEKETSFKANLSDHFGVFLQLEID